MTIRRTVLSPFLWLVLAVSMLTGVPSARAQYECPPPEPGEMCDEDFGDYLRNVMYCWCLENDVSDDPDCMPPPAAINIMIGRWCEACCGTWVEHPVCVDGFCHNICDVLNEIMDERGVPECQRNFIRRQYGCAVTGPDCPDDPVWPGDPVVLPTNPPASDIIDFATGDAGTPGSQRVQTGGVDLYSGTVLRTEMDIALPAPGFSWVIGRTLRTAYVEVDGNDDVVHNDLLSSPQGVNWRQTSYIAASYASPAPLLPGVLRIQLGETIYEFQEATTSDDIDALLGNGIFRSVSGNFGAVKWVTTGGSDNDYLDWYTPEGHVYRFFGDDCTYSNADFRLWYRVDAAGNKAWVGHPTTQSTAITQGYRVTSGSGEDGLMKMAVDTAGRRYTYSYSTSSPSSGNPARLTSVVVETKTGGNWEDNSASGVSEVTRVEYGYGASSGTPGANDGDLRHVVVTQPTNESGLSVLYRKHYRYYTQAWDNSDGRRGAPHQLRMELGFEGCRLYDALDAPNYTDNDYLSLAAASDADLKPYASAFYEYADRSYPTDIHGRVTSYFTDGQCGCSGGAGSGTYTMLAPVFNSPPTPAYAYDPDHQSARMSIQRPDGTYETYVFDMQQLMLARVISSGNPASSLGDFWLWESARNSRGDVTEERSPAANVSYTPGSWSISASSSVGLVTEYTYYTPEHSFPTLVRSVKVKKGTSGTPALISTTEYDSRAMLIEGAEGGEVFDDAIVRRMFVEHHWKYEQETSTEAEYGVTTPSGAIVTSMTYSWWEPTDDNAIEYVLMKSATTTIPAVDSSKNGSGSADTTVAYLRKDGTVALRKGPDGVFTYTRHEGGQVVMTVADVKTNSSSSVFFPGSVAPNDDPNTFWGITETGDGLHLLTSMTYDPQGRFQTATLPTGRVTRTYISRLADGRPVTVSIPRDASGTYYGPVGYAVANHAGGSVFQGTVAISGAGITTALASWIDQSEADPIVALDVGTLKTMSTAILTKTGSRVEESRAYFLVPGSGAGSDGTNYDPTFYEYDEMGRRFRVQDATGTISRNVYDTLGRATRRYTGTDDSSFNPSANGNMRLNDVTVYDSDADGGNSLVTSVLLDLDGDPTTLTSSDVRTTTYTHDYRGRTVLVTNPVAPHVFTKYDNMGRAMATGLFSATGGITIGTDDPTTETTNRIGLAQSFFDERGRVWKSQRHKIDPGDGSDDDNLQTLNWFDAAGRLVKTDGEQLTKTAYDRLGRPTNRFVLASMNDSTYADADDVSGDIVMEEHQAAYDSASGNALMSVSILRHYNEASGGISGALDTNADSDPMVVTAGNINGRVQITGMWYDELDRLTDTVALGTNGIVGDGSTSTGTFSRTTTSSPPARSDSALRTTTTYDTDGTVSLVTDPMDRDTAYTYDALRRVTVEIANHASPSPPITPADRDTNLYTRRVYTDGLMTKLWVDLDGDGTEDADDQVTVYTYGVTTSQSPGPSNLNSNRVLRQVAYPDSASGTDVVRYAYNAQGEEIWTKDQATNVIETEYDAGGRLLHKKATSVDADFDDAVERITMSYTSLGQVETVTQYDDPTPGSGTVVDEVKFTYDGWGPVSLIEQDFNSAVGAGTPDDREVGYSYEKATGGRNTIRRTQMTIPGGGGALTVAYDYDTLGSSTIPVNLSRPRYVKVGGTTVAEYTYTGADMVVGTRLSQPSVFNNAYAVGAATGVYAHIDPFNRVEDDIWWKDLSTDRAFVDLDIEYDRNSNIKSVLDNVLRSGASTRKFDAVYALDALNRLTRADEGQATGSPPAISTRSRDEDWTLSQTGNWTTNRLDLDGNGAYETTYSGTFNTVNELLTRSGQSNPSYDENGNLIDDGRDYTYTYDVFGRLRRVNNRTNPYALVAEYRYNGLNQRIGWHYDVDTSGTIDSSDPWYFFVYDEDWRQVSVFRGTGSGGTTLDSSPKELFVHHAAGLGGYSGSSYIDSVILRDRDNTNDWDGAADGTLEQRRYYCHNWRSDVAAILTSDGKMVEWVKYSAYGVPFGIPTGDMNSDGDWDASDLTAMQTWIGSYDVRLDTELDGDIDANDRTHPNSITGGYQTLGRGVLTSTGTANRRGYAGYQYEPTFVGHSRQLYHVRNRIYDSELGRWTRRDPAGYADNMGLYSYVTNNPIAHVDPAGLVAGAVSGGGSGQSGCSAGACSGGQIMLVGPPDDMQIPFEPRNNTPIGPTTLPPWIRWPHCSTLIWPSMITPEVLKAYGEAMLACAGKAGCNIKVECRMDDTFTQGCTVFIGPPGTSPTDDVKHRLEHELRHVAQNCLYGDIGGVNCDEKIRREYDAYMYARQCSGAACCSRACDSVIADTATCFGPSIYGYREQSRLNRCNRACMAMWRAGTIGLTIPPGAPILTPGPNTVPLLPWWPVMI